MRHRYETDAVFHQAVDVMQGLLERSMLTTEDIAQAAVLAAQIYAERHHAPVMILIDTRAPRERTCALCGESFPDNETLNTHPCKPPSPNPLGMPSPRGG